MEQAAEVPARAGPALGGGWVERWWAGAGGPVASVLDAALAPVELAYRIGMRLRNHAYSRGWLEAVRLPVPVVSVGNLTVGGTGKTPVSRWLVDELRRRGRAPAVLHGGYAPDEPALHRAWHPEIPVIEGRDRVAGARAAILAGATALVLDDGFQHRRLVRDLDVVLVAAERWSAAPRLLPRGPWREPPAALRRADLVAVTRKTAAPGEAERVAAALADYTDAAIVRLHLRASRWSRPDSGPANGPPAGEAVAVVAIAEPERFLTNARDAGARITTTLAFRDHYCYDARDIARLRQTAGGRAVVTTAKDAVKLAPLDPELDLWVLEQDVRVEAGAEVFARRLDLLVS
ncbi:MAG TPA: tetraacyldisaccharide 4'-kinase [Longimicrobiales bacterium]